MKFKHSLLVEYFLPLTKLALSQRNGCQNMSSTILRRSTSDYQWLGLLLVLLSIPSTANESLEVIEVSAQRHKQPLQQVPVSVSLLTAEQLAALAQPTIEQASERLPAVFAAPNSGSAKLFIRGIGSQGNAGMDQTVAVYLDDVYHGRSRIIKISLFDSENLEIFKGPQSLHFGVNTTGGVIALNSRGASLDENDGYLAFIAGEHQTWGMDFARNINFNEQWAVRTAIKLQDSDGYWDMIDNDGETVADSDSEQRAGRISLLWQPQQNLYFTLKLEGQHQQQDNPYAWQPGGCDNLYGLGLSSQAQLQSFWESTGSQQSNPLRVPYTCRDEFIDNDYDNRSPSSPYNQAELQHQVTVLSSHWQGDLFNAKLISSLYDTEFGFSGNDLSHGANFKRLYWSEDEVQQHAQELRLNGQFAEQFSWHAGLYWHDNKVYYSTSDLDARRQNNEQLNHAQAWQQERRLSAYGSLQWQATDALTLTPGLRWDDTHKHFSGLSNLYRAQFQNEANSLLFTESLLQDISADPGNYSQFNGRNVSDFQDQRYDFNALLPSLTVAWAPEASQYFWYKWQKGAKGGGFNFRLNNLSESELRYDEEQAFSHELGLRQQLWQRSMTVSLVLFHSNYRNLQQNSNMGEDGFIGGALIRNVAQARSQGVELDMSWRITPSWQINATGSWLDAEFSRYPGADCTRLQSVVSNTDVAELFGAQRQQGCFQDLSGATMPFAPDFSLSTTLTNVQKINKNYQLTSSLNWFYSDKYFTSPHADPLRQQPAFHKLNLSLVLNRDNEPWQIALYLNNLTDELTTGQLGQDGNAAVSALLDSPRHWLLRAEYKI